MANTANTVRITSSVMTAEGTNLSIVHMSIPYQRRAGNGNFKFLINDIPKYLPNVGQKVLIHHQDANPESSLGQVLETMNTNVAVGVFVEFQTGTTNVQYDDYEYALVFTYADNALINAGQSCIGTIEYDVSPTSYSILKPVESIVIVTDRVPYDGSEGDNYLIGSSISSGQTTANIAPMLFVEKNSSNTVFSNLYKSFNLPITADELLEFQQSELGYWITNYDTFPPPDGISIIKWHGANGYWYPIFLPLTGTTVPPWLVHPNTGYTGMFYNTVYESLAYAASGTTLIEKILVIEIPQGQYGEIIDGKTLKLKVLETGGPTFYDIYGAFRYNETGYTAGIMDNYLSETDYAASYFGNPPALSKSAYESNTVLLFCDDIKSPTSGGSWADGHDAAMNGERVYATDATNPKQFYDFFEDEAVGIAYLDRGFAVITNPEIVNTAFALYTGGTYANIQIAENIIVNYDGVDIDRNNSQFLWDNGYVSTGTTVVEYLSYNVEKSMNVVCLASTDEFYRSTNATAKVLANAVDDDFASFKNTISGSLYPVVITEIGLHDAQGNLLAIAKPKEPIKKYWYDLIAFNIKVRL